MQNQNVILPHCFMMNLVQAFVSGSKIVSVVNGKAAPGASYTTYKGWIAARGAKKIETPSKVDLITYFDNMGKYIVKDYRVLSSERKTANVITAVLHFILKDTSLQTTSCVQHF